jgi:hypothetical protein
VRIIDAITEPTTPPGWRVTPLRAAPDTRWLAWDDRATAVIVVIEIAPTDLFLTLRTAGYRLVAASATFEVWARRRAGAGLT